ncbi:glycoside hydrolase family 45 protein [Piromyces sp. E2]|nr:glycoside hydrolase family 45 protein [Piromyces sp. E2]|eukprot:OUM59868.1 glycoside hydrolase family 45 protein [Piromyces sp. E2]
MCECHDVLNKVYDPSEYVYPVGTKKGSTTRYWDCCKPSCSWPEKAPVSEPVRQCGVDGITPLSNYNVKSGCEGGDSFMCSDQRPWAVSEVLSYGFAAASISGLTEKEWCCRCYALTFTSGPVKGKQMVVQVTNTGGDLDDNHFDLQIPGGGFGIFNGCSSQFGTPDEVWGSRYGGVANRRDCDALPEPLIESCYWRFDWFYNADNPSMVFEEVECPKELTERTGCIHK